MSEPNFGAMVPDVFQQTCLTVETDMGTEHIPFDVLCGGYFKATDLGILLREAINSASREAELYRHIRDYIEGEPYMNTIFIEEGWLAYLTMPGYLDRTDYTLHETEEEAHAYLVETYALEDN
jgi:hypothetical protein